MEGHASSRVNSMSTKKFRLFLITLSLLLIAITLSLVADRNTTPISRSFYS